MSANKRNSADRTVILVMTIIIAVVAAVGGYAMVKKVKGERDAQRAAIAEYERQMKLATTVEGILVEQGITIEEFLTEMGLEGSGVTKDTSIQDLEAMLTIEQRAKYEGEEVDAFKAKYDIKNLDNTMLWTEAFEQVKVSTLATLSNVTFEEYLMQNQLPSGITNNMTVAQAREVIAAQQAAAETPAE